MKIVVHYSKWRKAQSFPTLSSITPNRESYAHWVFKFNSGGENKGDFFVYAKFKDAIKCAKEKAKQLNKTVIYLLG